MRDVIKFMDSLQFLADLLNLLIDICLFSSVLGLWLLMLEFNNRGSPTTDKAFQFLSGFMIVLLPITFGVMVLVEGLKG